VKLDASVDVAILSIWV